MSQVPAWKHRILGWLDRGEGTAGRVVQTIIITLIVVSVACFFLATDREILADHRHLLHRIEALAVALFTAEYLLRLWAASAAEPRGGIFRAGVLARLRYAASFIGLIDLAAILPFYLHRFSDGEPDLDLRFLRIARVLKLARYSVALQVLGAAFHRRRRELVGFGMIVLLALVLAGSIIWIFEHEAQPETFGSIPDTLWWAIVTMTTVGYGDAYPVTVLGKIFAGVVMLTGVGVIAVPTGLIGSSLSEEFARRALVDHPERCPTCGRPRGAAQEDRPP